MNTWAPFSGKLLACKGAQGRNGVRQVELVGVNGQNKNTMPRSRFRLPEYPACLNAYKNARDRQDDLAPHPQAACAPPQRAPNSQAMTPN